MPRSDFYLPPGDSVETTSRTLCGMFLLPATQNFSRIVIGILARAQELYPVKIHFGVMLRLCGLRPQNGMPLTGGPSTSF
jgi:hypothetical protein